MTKTAEIVEFLRAKMIRVADEKQSFTDPEVVAISQLLDQFIVQAQRVSYVQKPALTVVAQPVLTIAQSFVYGLRGGAYHGTQYGAYHGTHYGVYHGAHLRAVYSRN